jgi:hypothetical protein
MALSWLSKLLSTALVAVLTSTIISFVLNQTVLSSTYMKNKLAETHTYDRLSGALTDQVVRDSGFVSPIVTTEVHKVLTPEVIKTRLDSTLDQLEAYYNGRGKTPVIDVRDIAAQTQALGLPLSTPGGPDLTQPITLGNTSPNEKYQGISLTTVRMIGVVVSLLLAGLLVIVSWRRGVYKALPDVVISVGVLLGLLALVLVLVPGLFDHFVHFDYGSNVFPGIFHDLANTIAHDIAKRFGIIAAVCLLVGIVTRVSVGRLLTKTLAAVVPSPENTQFVRQ